MDDASVQQSKLPGRPALPPAGLLKDSKSPADRLATSAIGIVGAPARLRRAATCTMSTRGVTREWRVQQSKLPGRPALPPAGLLKDSKSPADRLATSAIGIVGAPARLRRAATESTVREGRPRVA